MIKILDKFNNIDDLRQYHKVKYLLKDIVRIILFSILANSDEWTEIEDFVIEYDSFLISYFELPTGIPFHDTGFQLMEIIKLELLDNINIKG